MKKLLIYILLICNFIFMVNLQAQAKGNELSMPIGAKGYIPVSPVEGVQYKGKLDKKGKKVVTMLPYKAGSDKLEFRSKKKGKAKIQVYYTYKNSNSKFLGTLMVNVKEPLVKVKKNLINTKEGIIKSVDLNKYINYINRNEDYVISLNDVENSKYVKITNDTWKYGQKAKPNVIFVKNGTYYLNVTQENNGKKFKKVVPIKVKNKGLSDAKYKQSTNKYITLTNDLLVVKDDVSVEDIAQNMGAIDDTTIISWEYWLKNNKQKQIDLNSEEKTLVHDGVLVGFNTANKPIIAVNVVKGVPVHDIQILSDGKKATSYTIDSSLEKKGQIKINLAAIIKATAKSTADTENLNCSTLSYELKDDEDNQLVTIKNKKLIVKTDNGLGKNSNSSVKFNAVSLDGSGITKEFECKIKYDKDGKFESGNIQEVMTFGGGGGGGGGGGSSSGSSSDSEKEEPTETALDRVNNAADAAALKAVVETAADATDLGLDLTTYNALEDKGAVMTALVAQKPFTDATAFKTAFDAAVAVQVKVEEEAAKPKFGVTSTTVDDGKVEMTVKAYNVKCMAAVQLDVKYDTNILTYMSYTKGAIAPEGAMVSVGEKKEGVATIAYIDSGATDAGADGTVLAVLTFTVNESVTATNTHVTLSLTDLYGEATEDITKNRAAEANKDARAEYGDPTDAAYLVPIEAVDVELPQEAVVDEEGTFVLTSEIVDGKV